MNMTCKANIAWLWAAQTDVKVYAYLRVKGEMRTRFVLVLKEHSALQTKFRNKDDDGIFPYKQNEAFLIYDSPILEKQLKRPEERHHVKKSATIIPLTYK